MNNLFIGQDGTVNGITLSSFLVAGRPGSGRFNFIIRYINDLIHSYTFEQLRIIFVDPKVVLLHNYQWLPQTLFGVVSKVDDFKRVLTWIEHEIEQRLRNPEKKIPIAIIVDEIADFMVIEPDYFEPILIKIAQNSAKTGIYLVLSTCRVDKVILTNDLRQAFNWRVAFGLNNNQESLLILNESGAEELTNPGECIMKDLANGTMTQFKVPYIEENQNYI